MNEKMGSVKNAWTETMEILKDFEQVEPFLSTLINTADAHRDSLGFLPPAAYREQAAKGRLWVAIDSATESYAGHLMFSGDRNLTALKITQMLVHPDFRGKKIARRLFNELVAYGEEKQFMAITARVADDLSVNAFWEKVGLKQVRQVPGGQSKNRIINYRRLDLKTPNLFDYHAPPPHKGITEFRLRKGPLLDTQKYAFDLNVMFDVVRDREGSDEARKLIGLALQHKIQLFITEEFITELERTSKKSNDPVLAFAVELPALPAVDETILNDLAVPLRELIFPHRDPKGKKAENDQSDLKHLAHCIASGIQSFITRETAILRVADELEAIHGLEVVSAWELIDPEDSFTTFEFNYLDRKLRVIKEDDAPTNEVIQFIADSTQKASLDASHIWHRQSKKESSERLVALIEDSIIGAATWLHASDAERNIALHLYVDESYPQAIHFIDHVFNSILAEQTSVSLITLHVGTKQPVTLETAGKLGFVAYQNASKSGESLAKLRISGVAAEDNWNMAVDACRRAISLEIPTTIPGIGENITVKHKTSLEQWELSMFDFQTLISPLIILAPGSKAVITPIKPSYTDTLLEAVDGQLLLWVDKEAILRTERVYFSSPRNISRYTVGGYVFFYVSKKMQLYGVARVTSSQVVSVADATHTLLRQGVLEADDLEEIAEKGKLHALTFDNYVSFPQKVAYCDLKKIGCTDGANYVCPKVINVEQARELLKVGLEE